MDETTLTILKVIEEKDMAIKQINNRLERYYTVTSNLLERINYNLVENQISPVGDNFGPYEIIFGKLVIYIDLLEPNLNQYLNFNKGIVFAVKSCYQILIKDM